MNNYINQFKKDLKCVSAGELFYRGWFTLLKKADLLEKKFKPGWMRDEEVLRSWNNTFNSKGELINYLRERNNVNFFFSKDEKNNFGEVLNSCFPKQRGVLVDKAEAILRHNFEIQGQRFYFDNEINWHSVANNLQWPLEHWSKLNINADKYGDIRPVWELNRHQHFCTLGRAYWWTGDEKYAKEFAVQLRSWIEQNPPEMGVNWQSNLEIAVRCITWIFSFQYFIKSNELDDDLLFDWVRAIIHSAIHIEKHINYSWYCIHNNHLIGEAVGLAIVAQFFPELKITKRWKNKAVKILYNELFKQVYPDGVNWEQSIYYHRFVLYLYLIFFRMEQLNGNNVPMQSWKHLEKMFDFLLWVKKPSGFAPNIGDNDDGVAVWLCNEAINDIRPALSTGAILFGREDLKYAAGQLSEETVWMLGLNSVNQWKGLSGKKLENTFMSFSVSGFYISRSGWEKDDFYLLLKSGPQADHAHADQLHIELCDAGKDLLIDPGTYVYNANPEWRNYFRSTHAHNTVVIDGVSQSIPHRTFRWIDEAKPLEIDTYEGKYVHWIQGGHTGYRRLTDPVVHKRDILSVVNEYVFVFDNFAAKANHQYDFLFHFPPGEALVNGNKCILSNSNAINLNIYPIHYEIMQMEIIAGQKNPSMQGWYSLNYGFCEPAPVFYCRTEANGEWCTGFVLFPFKEDKEKPEVRNLGEGVTSSVIYEIKQGDIKDYVIYGGENEKIDSVSTNALLVFYRKVFENPYYIFSKLGSQLIINNIVKIKGSWNKLELCFFDNMVQVSGDMVNELNVEFEMNFDLNVDDNLVKNKVSETAWVIKNTGEGCFSLTWK